MTAVPTEHGCGDPSEGKRIRILLLSVALTDLGPTRNLYYLATQADRRRFEFELCVMQAGDAGPFEDRFRETGMPVHRLNMAGAFDVRGIVRLARLVAERRPHIIHARLVRAGFFARVAARISRPFRPRVLSNIAGLAADFTTLHGRFLGPLLCALERATANWGDAIVANSQAVAEDWIRAGVVPTKMRVIPNAIDTPDFEHGAARRAAVREAHGVSRDQTVLITVSRLHSRKRVPELIDWLSPVLQDLTSVTFWVVGEGPDRPQVEAEVARQRLDGRIRLLGQRRDVPELLAAADVFVYGSLWESSSNALLEAMAAGLPIVATAAPGIDELVAHGQTGWVCQSSREMPVAVRTLLEDVGRRRALGDRARVRATTDFSIRAMIDSFESAYLQVLSSPAS